MSWKQKEIEREYHPKSDLFPLMDGGEFEELKADIAQNGLLEPIILHPDGQIIDGRNRHRACIETDTRPRFETWDEKSSLVQFVVSKNLHRRHLTSSQRAAISLDALEMLEEEREHGGDRRSDDFQDGNNATSKGKARDDAAAMFQTNPRYVQDAKKLRDEAPDLLNDVRSGEKSITQARRKLKERKREKTRQENRTKIEEAPDITTLSGVWSTIVVDPPWDWDDEGDISQFGRGRPEYATMSYEELLSFPVGGLAADDAHIYLWITNRSLPKGFSLLKSWGFRYITAITWVKPRFGMGNYFRGQTEHVLFGVRGSLSLKRKDVGTVFNAPRGPDGHSSKPEKLYEIVESCSPSPYLDLFGRRHRDGWIVWGENGVIDG